MIDTGVAVRVQRNRGTSSLQENNHVSAPNYQRMGGPVDTAKVEGTDTN